MSTDATASVASSTHSVRDPQPILPHNAQKRSNISQNSSNKAAMAEPEAKKRSQRSMMGYFPLGYKDAVHQWVCIRVPSPL